MGHLVAAAATKGSAFGKGQNGIRGHLARGDGPLEPAGTRGGNIAAGEQGSRTQSCQSWSKSVASGKNCRNARSIAAPDVSATSSAKPNPITAVVPSDRARSDNINRKPPASPVTNTPGCTPRTRINTFTARP
jgi:hypothetical protein